MNYLYLPRLMLLATASVFLFASTTLADEFELPFIFPDNPIKFDCIEGIDCFTVDEDGNRYILAQVFQETFNFNAYIASIDADFEKTFVVQTVGGAVLDTVETADFLVLGGSFSKYQLGVNDGEGIKPQTESSSSNLLAIYNKNTDVSRNFSEELEYDGEDTYIDNLEYDAENQHLYVSGLFQYEDQNNDEVYSNLVCLDLDDLADPICDQWLDWHNEDNGAFTDVVNVPKAIKYIDNGPVLVLTQEGEMFIKAVNGIRSLVDDVGLTGGAPTEILESSLNIEGVRVFATVTSSASKLIYTNFEDSNAVYNISYPDDSELIAHKLYEEGDDYLLELIFQDTTDYSLTYYNLDLTDPDIDQENVSLKSPIDFTPNDIGNNDLEGLSFNMFLSTNTTFTLYNSNNNRYFRLDIPSQTYSEVTNSELSKTFDAENFKQKDTSLFVSTSDTIGYFDADSVNSSILKYDSEGNISAVPNFIIDDGEGNQVIPDQVTYHNGRIYYLNREKQEIGYYDVQTETMSEDILDYDTVFDGQAEININLFGSDKLFVTDDYLYFTAYSQVEGEEIVVVFRVDSDNFSTDVDPIDFIILNNDIQDSFYSPKKYTVTTDDKLILIDNGEGSTLRLFEFGDQENPETLYTTENEITYISDFIDGKLYFVEVDNDRSTVYVYQEGTGEAELFSEVHLGNVFDIFHLDDLLVFSTSLFGTLSGIVDLNAELSPEPLRLPYGYDIFSILVRENSVIAERFVGGFLLNEENLFSYFTGVAFLNYDEPEIPNPEPEAPARSGGGGTSSGSTKAAANPDTPSLLTYEQEVAAAIAKGIITKEPTAETNKCEALMMISRAFNWTVPQATTSNYTDVPDWCLGLAAYGTTRKIVEGRTPTTLGLSTPVTRDEVALMLYRELKIQGYSFTGTQSVTFTDNLTPWASEAIRALTAESIIKGFSDGTFKGSASIIKQDLAVMLLRTANNPLYTGTTQSQSNPLAD